MNSLHDVLTTIYRHAEAHMPTEELQSVVSVMTQEAAISRRAAAPAPKHFRKGGVKA
jgi:hypothetical protein